MITMVIFVLVIAAVSQIFTGLLSQFKQQSKVAETNIEGIVGLDMMRQDIARAGYGVPWVIPATASYSEVPAGSAGDAYNECIPPATVCSTAPRAAISGSGAGWNGSDELVIRATNIARNTASQAWTTLAVGDVKRAGLSGETLADTDKVIAVAPGNSPVNARTLVVSSADTSLWDTTYSTTTDFAPLSALQTYIIYGIDGSNIRMPFNRADYYISTSNVPSHCAPNTGVLMKSVLSQADGTRTDMLPLLDCVADMQVVYRFDTSTPPDGTADLTTDDLSTIPASQIRTQLMDIRVYILAHEGQRDPSFTYATNPVYVGDPGIGGGRNFNFSTATNPITNWQNYRWKLYSIVVQPNNLR